MAVCSRCGAENAAAAKFCNACGAPFAPPPQQQRKTVTVLFCDVSGSTSLGERLDPEALRAVMTRYFDVARAAIERHGGTVEKFIGDAVMAVFGIPVAHEDDALRAVRAAQELRDAVEIEVRIGVNTGTVVTGGGDSTFATGDAVNAAARLEQAAGTGEVLLGAKTYGIVRDAVVAELLPPLAVKGKAEPLTAYRLRAVTGEPTRRDAAPMVGRAAELDLLRRAYERTVHEHACHLFTVVGTAGIGKSRLVREFLTGVADARVLAGRCLPYGEGITYSPVVEVLKQLDAPLEEEAVRRPLAALLGDDGTPTSPPETAWAVRKTLERAALDRPLVVVFDDIQWGEATFLELIEHVADLSRGVPIFLLCMARPELHDARPGWGGGKLNATSVLLEPLPPDEAATLVRSLLDGDDESLVAKIGAAADGNPLFVEEMVELARDTGGEVAVPPSIQALLTARLDSLPQQERTVLERGAVEGQVFHRNAVAALAPDEHQVDSRLGALVRKELVRPEVATLAADDAYRFRHLLIRDAAYEALPKATRIELHERFASWLEEHGADLVELDEIVGYHLEQAAHYSVELALPAAARATRAATRLAAAARRANARGDVRAVLNLGERAGALFPPEDRRRLELLAFLAWALYENGRLAEAEAILDEVVRCPDPVLAARGWVIRTRLHTSAAGDENMAELDDAYAVLREAGDEADGAEIEYTRALLLFYRGRIGAAFVSATNAAAHARNAGSLRLEGLALEVLGSAYSWGDTPWPAVERYTRERVADERLGPRARARALTGLARCLWMRREFGAAEQVLAEARRAFDDLGLSLFSASLGQLAADLEWTRGDYVAMERFARDAWERLSAVGETGFRSTVGVMLGDALVRLGRVGEATEFLDAGVALGSPDDYVTSCYAAATRALVAAAEDDPDRALAEAARALRIVDETDALDHRVRVRIFAAEACVAIGRAEQAERLIAAALELAAAKQSLALADRARSVLQPAAR